MPTSHLLSNLQTFAEDKLKEHDIPAISLAVWHNGKLQQAAAGIVNINTGVTATTDSLFHIGSITKVMTASLVMRLVDQGKIDLDQPVQKYLRDFQLADSDAAAAITVCQLLNHSSGMAGDYFPDDHDHSGNLIARFMDRCALLPVIHPVGKMHSYSNSAYAVAGRLIEVVSGKSWYQAMQEDIFRPLGMTQSIADPKEMIRYRTAVGHTLGNDNAWEVPDKNYLTLGQAPCGSTPATSAADLITFARAFLDRGENQQGEHWLSEQAVKVMQTPTMEKPNLSLIHKRFIGLGWGVTDFYNPPLRVFSHSGAVCGSKSMLQIIPEHNAAFAVLINGHSGSALNATAHDCLMAIAGIDNREPNISPLAADSERDGLVEGVYESFDAVITVKLEEQYLYAYIDNKIDPIPSAKIQLTHLNGLCYAVFDRSGLNREANLTFLDADTLGQPRYLYIGSRLNTRRA